MNLKEAQEIQKNLWSFCKKRKGKLVFVGGMWSGDFLGTIVSHGFTEATFHVERRLNGAVDCDTYTFGFGAHLILREPTDEERQLDIAEVYGTVQIA